MQPIPYLFFDGTCEEALRAYARIFGTPEPEILRAGEAPEGQGGPVGPEAVMHGAVRIGEGVLYGSDFPGAGGMTGSCVCVALPHADESRRIFEALSHGGTVEMALEKTFFSPAFGIVTDRWGTRWMVDTALAGNAPAAREAEGAAAGPR
ncbi:VOC family protein [Rubellimicrobium sp. CFH 75288]|uniref:VOC family protein n=1 Tax=Rubellimicrobium sp. CFH 75288 TaxID=2697034 RepID=UPI0014135AB5|nr:VOC family protein [Rubellimicrobium sp. CFH 75288]NAZ36283.1 VOC family protein [Rubellimicrobium sp. CFH 75288]